MGCAASKGAAVGSPGYEAAVSGSAASIWSRPLRLESFDLGREAEKEEEEAGEKKKKNGARRPQPRNLQQVHGRHVDAEHAAAGWPAWLSSAAAEAVHGWVPLKADRFEKLEKIGQGTYSSVFRAWDLDSGRAVALKKVRFDASEPGSVRFMAREVVALRRLHGHPNVVSLHGLVVPRSSSPSHLYLVLEFLPHDLAGLLSPQSQLAPFSQPQIKSYMRQLMAGLEHCHGRGVMHRDVKSANLLVSAHGELKVADFGLANIFFSGSGSRSHSPSPPMTSRVVTLWYRPPELLLGATAYGPAVDLWSAGCVFAELHAGRPVLQGRTEVEQIHKIFKLCGSPADDDEACWASSAAAFRPQTPYESHLREAFGPPALLPDEPAFALLETLLSVDPRRRGTAAAALASGYLAADPEASSPALPLPQPPPQRAAAVHAEESLLLPPEEAAPKVVLAGPVQLSASTGFAWAKKPRNRAPPDAASKPKPRPSKASAYEAEKQEMMKQWAQAAEAFCAASSPGDEEEEDGQRAYSSSSSSSSRSIRDAAAKQLNKSSSSRKGMARADYSGPLLSQPGRVDELLRSHEQQIRRRAAAARRSWFHRGSKRQQQPSQ